MRHALVLTAAIIIASPAAVAETWRPISKTALSITGKVQFFPSQIVFQNGSSLPIKVATPEGMDGQVFKVLRPADPILVHGNKLCGNGPVTFFVVSKGDGNDRELAVFTTAAEPGQEKKSCATYSFKAGR